MRSLPIIAIVALLEACPLHACPNCNIYNYLASSVESSTNVYIGQVVVIHAKDTALVKVVEVLRGSHSPGDQLKVEFNGNADNVGTKYLFSNPTSWPPNFPTLPLWLKDEVSFLVRKNRQISNPDDAVAKMQGISKVTTDMALKYIKAHFPECRDHLFAAYRGLYKQQSTWKEDDFISHRFEMLVTAITSTDDPKGIEFLLGCIDALAAEPGGDISLEYRPLRGEPQGNILRAMIATRKEGSKSYKKLSARIKLRIGEMDGSGIRWFAYALAFDDLQAAGRLFQTLNESARAAAAVGVFDLSEYYRSWWAIEECDSARRLALSLHDSYDLRNLAKEQNKRLESFRSKDDH